jgi:hypothetical protein
VPETSVCDAGVTASEKSGVVAVMVRAMVAVWLSLPEVPVRVTVAEPAVTALLAVRVTLCAVPAAKVSVAGFAVTPAGSPLRATVTGAANPFIALAVTLTGCPAAPPLREAVAGETPREKSGEPLLADVLLPPQPMIAAEIITMTVTNKDKTRSSQRLRMTGPPCGRAGRHIDNISGV